MCDLERQRSEIEVLKSIYNSDEIIVNDDENGLISVQFYAFQEISGHFSILFVKNEELKDEESKECDTLSLKHLPPIELYAELPFDYPSVSSPEYKLSCVWLTKEMLLKLYKKLNDIWNEYKSSEILFLWTEFLKVESLSLLELGDCIKIDIKCFNSDLPVSKTPILNKVEETHMIEDEVKEKNMLDRNKNETNKEESLCAVNMTETIGNGNINENIVNKELTECQLATGDTFNCKNLILAQGKSKPDEESSNKSDTFITKDSDITDNLGLKKTNSDCPNTSNSLNLNCDAAEFVPGVKVHNERYFYNKNYKHFHNKRNNKGFMKNNSNDFNSHSNVNMDANSLNYKYPLNKKISDTANVKKNIVNDKYDTKENKDFNDVSNNLKYNSSKNTESKSDENVIVDSFLKESTKENLEESFLSLTNSKPSDINITHFASIETSESNLNKMDNHSSFDASDNKMDNSDLNIENIKTNYKIDKSDIHFDIVNTNVKSGEIPKKCKSKVMDSNFDKEMSLNVSNCTKKRIGNCITHFNYSNFIKYLQEYNQEKKYFEFQRAYFDCPICFETKRGDKCIHFEQCDHVFCKECLGHFILTKINDGSVYVIKCPESKCTTEITPPQVRDAVGQEDFLRYDNLLLTTTLQTMTDITPCPRISCQYPVTREPNEKMAVCPSCNYVFCVYCRLVYHGIEACRLRNDEKAALVKKYCEASGEEKVALEQRYGKKQLMSLVQSSLSEAWIYDNSQNCPHCNASIEKSGGCNKMVCWRCSTYFCWLCRARLDPEKPYLHYLNKTSGCYKQLFQGVIYSDEEEEDFFVEDFDEYPGYDPEVDDDFVEFNENLANVYFGDGDHDVDII